MSGKQYYHLASAELLFSDGEGNSGATRLNAIVKGPTNLLRMQEIGRAQQAAQVQLMQRMNDPKLAIHDVTIIAMTYLGHMSEEQFAEGMEHLLAPEPAAKVNEAPAGSPLAPGVLGNGS